MKNDIHRVILQDVHLSGTTVLRYHLYSAHYCQSSCKLIFM